MQKAGLTDAQIKALGLTPGQDEQTTKSPATASSSADVKSTTPESASSAFGPSSITTIPSIAGTKKSEKKAEQANTQQLQTLMAKQQSHIAEQRYQTKIKQLSAHMLSAARVSLQGWASVPTQVFIMASEKDGKSSKGGKSADGDEGSEHATNAPTDTSAKKPGDIYIKTGDILFAVLETSVNTDEPGPILATIVSGKLKGSKIIGSFTLPSNADQIVITFNTLSMPWEVDANNGGNGDI